MGESRGLLPMSFRINSNTAANNVWRVMNGNQNSWAKSMERLSSGSKINRAADNPAGLIISMTMRAQMGGINQAIENSERAVSMLQSADSGLSEVHAQLLAMREIAVDAANSGTHSSEDLAVMQAEIQSSLDSIDSTAANTQFGTVNLLDGSSGVQGTVTSGDVTFLDGTTATASDTFEVVVDTQATQAAVATTNSGPIAGIAADETLTITSAGAVVDVDLLAGDDAQTIVDKINATTDTTDLIASTDGTNVTLTSSMFGSAGDFTVSSSLAAGDGSQSGFAAGAGDSGTGADIEGHFVNSGVSHQATGSGATLTGVEGSAAEGLQVQTDAAVGSAGEVLVTNNQLVFQVGANAGQTTSIALDSVDSANLGTGLDTLGGDNMFADLGEIDVTSVAGASDAIEIIDQAISQVSTMRAEVGSFQSTTLESGINNLRVSFENLTAANSTIADTDIASEWTNFVKFSTFQQQGAMMLAHANMGSQLVLSLLK
ncbi:MAG: hypothetical protein GY835_12110 [bacterium]|nr:hypothetical protein [bacterium]